MKILYVKNNSERAKRFQLRTTVYEKDGQKYVTKKALYPEAIAHLKNMKNNYTLLSNTIINPRIRLAKITHETEDSLTFEFIHGISLEKQYYDAKNIAVEKAEKVRDTYLDILKTSFKTTRFDSSTMLTEQHRLLFGDIDYTQFNGELCFDGISNLDLIFSNIISKDNNLYLIDYEWVFDINMFVDYAAYRALHHNHDKWYNLEEHFLDKFVIGANGFHNVQHNYLRDRPKITALQDHIQELIMHAQGKEDHINELAGRINKLDGRIHNLGQDLSYARSVVELRDTQISFLTQINHTLRLKNRIKNIIPRPILKLLGYTKPPAMDMNDFPHKISKKPAHVIYKYKEPDLTNDVHNIIKKFKITPLISIIMPVYNVDPIWLDFAIKSIENQWYKNWELCIADDKSTKKETLDYLRNIKNPKIKTIFLQKNINISGATNAALELASGEYIALMDNDDEITPDALYEIVKVINEKGADFIYSDEDFISITGECSNPHLKPDFSPDLLMSHNYITHFTCFKKSLLNLVGLFNPKYDGAQDYDLFLRLTEQTSKIYHIQKVLYHWRMLETSTSANSEAKPEAINRGKLVLEAALKRKKIAATVEHANMHHYFRVKYTIKDNPLVSIIMPFKDKPELLDMSISSILEKSTYQNYEIIGISNNSQDPEIFQLMAELEQRDPRISFYEYNTEFNYADINNHGVNTYAKGEHILLLNNDIEVISPDWIESMLEHSQRKEIGCVGAKLYFPNDTIQHAGVIIGLGGYAGHSHKMYPRDNPGYFNRLNVIQNLSALTAACLMIKKSIYKEVHGMNAIEFKVAYNDVDFCLRVLEKGYLNLFTPYAQMYHHESISRGYETTPDKIARFKTEKDALYKRHTFILDNGDPYYNPGLTQDKEDFSLCFNQ